MYVIATPGLYSPDCLTIGTVAVIIRAIRGYQGVLDVPAVETAFASLDAGSVEKRLSGQIAKVDLETGR